MQEVAIQSSETIHKRLKKREVKKKRKPRTIDNIFFLKIFDSDSDANTNDKDMGKKMEEHT